MFRRQARKEEDAISEALLASIPEVGAAGEGKKAAKPPTRFVEMPEPPTAPSTAPSLAQMRQELESVFTREITQVEQAVAAALRQMEERLVKANDEIAILRLENAELQRARDANAKRLEALRSLALREEHD